VYCLIEANEGNEGFVDVVKNIIGIVLSIVTGIFLGFFGALNSVFSDGELNERLVFIGIILVIYGILGAVWGFLIPRFSWKWGLFLGSPGVLILLLFTLFEFNPYFLIYIALNLLLACGGAWGGNSLRKRVKNRV
jgi:hypothetical protein